MSVIQLNPAVARVQTVFAVLPSVDEPVLHWLATPVEILLHVFVCHRHALTDHSDAVDR